MVELYKYHIDVEIECDDFEAESQEEAEELLAESISDNYGIWSAIKSKHVYLARRYIRKGTKPLSEEEYRKLSMEEAEKYVPLDD
jgi:hypothetical protein